MDNFMEMMVTKKLGLTDYILYALTIIITLAIVFFSATFIKGFGPFIAIVTLYLGWTLLGNFKKEYEYSFTAGELDFDVIYAAKRRRHILSVKCRNLSSPEKVTSSSFAAEKASSDKVYNLCRDINGEDSYYSVFSENNRKNMIIFSPSEKLINNIKMFSERGIH